MGNSYLCCHDSLKWLARIMDRLVRLHAKDISGEQSSAERGKVTGTPVGCAWATASSTGPRSSISAGKVTGLLLTCIKVCAQAGVKIVKYE